MQGLIWRTGRVCRQCLQSTRLKVNTHHIRIDSSHRSASTGLQVKSTPLKPFRAHPSIAKPTQPSENNLSAEILEQCTSRGIKSLDDLHCQASFNPDLPYGQHILDSSDHRHDLKLWLLLLRYGLLAHGPTSLERMLHAMQYRAPSLSTKVDLSADDPDTAQLWTVSVETAVAHKLYAALSIITDPKGVAWNRPLLGPEILCALMRDDLSEAITIGLKLKHLGHPSMLDVGTLFCIYDPGNMHDLQKFLTLYNALEFSSLYDVAISHLLSRNRGSLAIQLHTLLLDRNDLPQSTQNPMQLARELAKRSQPLDAFLHKLEQKGLHISAEIGPVYHAEIHDPGESSETSTGNSVSDAFAAKVFATKTISFNFVLASLKVLGLSKIGPQALREIGLNADGPHDFRDRLKILKDNDVSIEINRYSQVLLVLANRQSDTLMQQVLETDLHHTVFDDSAMLRQLLKRHVQRQDWNEVNLLCAILCSGNVTDQAMDNLSKSMRHTINDILVRSSPRAALGSSLIADTLDSRNNIRARKDIITSCFNYLESLSQAGKRGPQTNLITAQTSDYAMLMIGMMQDAEATGVYSSLNDWAKAVRSLVRLGELQDVYNFLRSLPYQLASIQASTDPSKNTSSSAAAAINVVFPADLQTILLGRSIEAASFSKRLRHFQAWKEAMDLFASLRNEHNLQLAEKELNEELVRQSFKLLPITPRGLDLAYLGISHRFLCELLNYWWAVTHASDQDQQAWWRQNCQTFRTLIKSESSLTECTSSNKIVRKVGRRLWHEQLQKVPDRNLGVFKPRRPASAFGPGQRNFKPDK